MDEENTTQVNYQSVKIEDVVSAHSGGEKIKRKNREGFFDFLSNDMIIFNAGIVASMLLSGWSLWTGIDKIWKVDDKDQNAAFLHADKIILQVFIVFVVVLVGGSILKNWHKLYHIGEETNKYQKKVKIQVGIAIAILIAAEFASRVAIFVDFKNQTVQQWLFAIAVTLLVLVPALPGTAIQLLREKEEIERDVKENERYARRAARAAYQMGAEILENQIYNLNPNDPHAFKQLAELMPGFQSRFRSDIRDIIEADYVEITAPKIPEQKLLDAPKDVIMDPQIEDGKTRGVTPIRKPRKRSGRKSQVEIDAINGIFVTEDSAL